MNEKKSQTKEAKSPEPREERKLIDSEIEFEITDSFLQLPVREGKNSLFLELQNLSLTQVRAAVDSKKTILLDSQLISLFVAQQFDQSPKYNLIKMTNMSINGVNQSFGIEITKILAQMNENYIIFISKLAEENFDDSKALVGKVQRLSTLGTIQDGVTHSKKPG